MVLTTKMINSYYTIFYTCFFIYLVNIVVNTGYIFTYDTNSYLKAYSHAQPAYTIFIHVIKKIIGPSSFKEIIIAIQLIASYTTIIYFCNVCRKYFNFNTLINIVIFLLLTHPIYGSYRMCNKLITEPMAYSFFLLFLASGIKLYFKKKNKHIYLMILFLSIIILTRAQLLSVWVGFTFFIWYLWDLKTLRKRILLFIVILTIPISTSIIEKTFYWGLKGHFVSRQLGNMCFATLPFFLSDSNDIDLMPDEESRYYFQCVYESLENQKLLASQLPSNATYQDKQMHYHNNYAKISNGTIAYEARYMFNTEYKTHVEIFINSSRVMGKTIKPLFMARPLDWFKVFYYNLAFPYYSSIIIFILIILSCYLFFKKRISLLNNQPLIFLFSLLILGNVLLISISVHPIRRYFIYFDIVVLLLCILLLGNINSLKKYIHKSPIINIK